MREQNFESKTLTQLYIWAKNSGDLYTITNKDSKPSRAKILGVERDPKYHYEYKTKEWDSLYYL